MPGRSAERFPDLVKRQFRAEAPGRLLVADFTCVPLGGGGLAYVAFVIDACAGTIRGRECSLSKTTVFIQRAIRQAAGQLRRLGHPITGSYRPRADRRAEHSAPGPAPKHGCGSGAAASSTGTKVDAKFAVHPHAG